MLPLIATAQEKEKVKSLEELRQLERGVVRIDEIEPLIYEVPDVPELQEAIIFSYGGQTKINLRKGLDNVSLSHKYTFNVEEKYSNIDFFIRGDIAEGSFSIKLIKPDKTVMKDIKITPEHDFIWKQPFILDKVKKGGIGKWTVEFSAKEATGYFQFYCSSR
jgi:hypothetical protein